MPETRIPLADAAYLQLIGQAAYMATYVEWTILGDLTPLSQHLPQELSVDRLAGKPMGEIAKQLNQHLGNVQEPVVKTYLENGALCLEAISKRRNHLLHARPATVGGDQVLYRWRRARGDQFAITYEWLQDMIAFIDEWSVKLEGYRQPTLVEWRD